VVETVAVAPVPQRIVGLTPTGKKVAIGIGILLAVGIAAKVIAGHR
jgi:hypothetical protein